MQDKQNLVILTFLRLFSWHNPNILKLRYMLLLFASSKILCSFMFQKFYVAKAYIFVKVKYFILEFILFSQNL